MMFKVTDNTFIDSNEVCSIEDHVVKEYSSPSISDNSMHVTFDGSKVVLKNGRKIYVSGLRSAALIEKLGIPLGISKEGEK